MSESDRAHKGRVAVREFSAIANALIITGQYAMADKAGQALEKALKTLRPEIYGSMSDPDRIELKGLEYILDRLPKGIEECSRVVRDGGKIVVADITSQGTPLLAGIRLGLRYLRTWGRVPASNRNISLDELVRLTQDAGFLVKDEALIGTSVKAACVTGYKQG